MSKIHGMMDVGKRSMMNSQTALQTVGHNIANKNTEGYSRQRVEIQTAEPNGFGKLRIGTGSKTAAINRVNNPYLERQIGQEKSLESYYKSNAEVMTRVEQVYNEQVNKSLNLFLSEFFNAFRDFATNPESLATRTHVKETAEFVTRDFKRIHTQLTDIQSDIDQQIMTNVADINEITREIANLNGKIHTIHNTGGPANDERDRRDLLLKNLGEKVNIRWAEGKDGMVTITAGNSALLVAGTDSKSLETGSTPESPTKREGRLDVFFVNDKGSEPVKVTSQFVGGHLGGLLEVRDSLINGLIDDVDSMAFRLVDSVNSIHAKGYNTYGKSGQLFFETPIQVRGAADSLSLSSVVARDVGQIAAGAIPGAPGDNRIANMISQLQYQNIMGEGTATLDEFYNSMVGRVGIQARRAETAFESQSGIVKQLSNIRESISGVSLDEETTKLIEFQKAFDASARLIRTADEMFDTVLNLKRM